MKIVGLPPCTSRTRTTCEASGNLAADHSHAGARSGVKRGQTVTKGYTCGQLLLGCYAGFANRHNNVAPLFTLDSGHRSVKVTGQEGCANITECGHLGYITGHRAPCIKSGLQFVVVKVYGSPLVCQKVYQRHTRRIVNFLLFK